MKKPLAALASALLMLVFVAGHAGAQYELVQIVTQRNALMKTMLSAYWPLQKINNGENSDLSDGGKAARTIAEAADRIVSLFPAGTAKGEVPGTRARPEIWSKPEEFQAAVDLLKDTAGNLQAAAEAGDMAAFKTRFDAFMAACTGCHSFRPSGDGKFRFPK